MKEQTRFRHRLAPVFVAVATALVAGAVVVLTRQAPDPAPAAPTSAQRVISPFDLLTHCGVDEAKVEDVYYEAVTPLAGPAHSAPAGWGNPYQRGTMTLYPPDVAVFHDTVGHEVMFRARPGATAFKQLCD